MGKIIYSCFAWSGHLSHQKPVLNAQSFDHIIHRPRAERDTAFTPDGVEESLLLNGQLSLGRFHLDPKHFALPDSDDVRNARRTSKCLVLFPVENTERLEQHPEGIKVSIGVELDQTTDGVAVNYTVTYPLEPKPETRHKQKVQKAAMINFCQGELLLNN